VEYQWAPDSRHVVTAVVSPRLRVDNGFKVWLYDGTLVHQEKFDELYEISWKNVPPSTFPDRPPSPRVYAASKPDAPTAVPQPAKYVHPNAKFSGGVSIKKQEDGPVKYIRGVVQGGKQEEYIPGFSPEPTKPKKNKKNKSKKKQENEENSNEKVEEAPVLKTEEVNESNNNNTEQQEMDPQKRAKIIQKKLRQIDELKQQRDSGKVLDSSQVEKITTEKSLRDELKKLKI